MSILTSQDILIKPHEISTIKLAVKENMKKSIKSWNYKINGICLKNKSANFKDKSAEIVKEEGTLIVTLCCQSDFFLPHQGLLVGKVEEINSSYIQLSIFGVFKAFIYKKDISNDKFKFSHFKWNSCEKENVFIEKESLIQFMCNRYEVKDNFITFEGSLENDIRQGLYYELEEDNQIVI